MKKRKLKNRKWYSTNVTPDCKYGLIVQTDMGYIFEAIYEDGIFKVSNVRDYKIYYEPTISQISLVRWMKVYQC